VYHVTEKVNLQKHGGGNLNSQKVMKIYFRDSKF